MLNSTALQIQLVSSKRQTEDFVEVEVTIILQIVYTPAYTYVHIMSSTIISCHCNMYTGPSCKLAFWLIEVFPVEIFNEI